VTYEDAVAYMSGLLQFGMRLDRERFAELLRRLGDPHQKLRCVHVAGTNGKGSTTTFIATVLREAGYSVGAYLSPYVFDLRERILFNGEMIGREDFARHVAEIRPHIEAVAQTELGPTTEFELKTAVMFKHFAERVVDFAVIEVGIGGRLDATNVIPPPLVAVITSIGWDHMAILGDTLGKIAGEKAGIVKRGTPACVTAVPPGEALDVIAAKCAAEGVPLRRVAPMHEAAPDHTGYAAENGSATLLRLPGDIEPIRLNLTLRGPFQAANAATAATAASVLRETGTADIPDAALRRGLERATLPGRFQITRDGRDGRSAALVLDVAHNEDGARVLAESLHAEFGPDARCTFVVGMSRAHEPEPFLRELLPLTGGRLVVTAPAFRPKPAGEVAASARTLGLEVTVVEPASRAIAETYETARPGEVVVVTGSFYTVGETPEPLR
jgi:dihydrofolate synthase/folylpolyglutamate synthase